MTSALAAGAVLYTVFIFLPGQRKLSTVRQKLHQQQQFVVASERLRSTIAATEHVLTEVSQYCGRWDCNRPLGRRLPEFLARVTESAASHDVVLVRLTPDNAERFHSFQRIPLTISVAGPLNGVLEFLRELDDMPELHWIDQLDLEPDSRNDGEVTCTFQLVLFAGFSDKSN